MKKNTDAITTWLFTGCILIFCMVVIGGITRLTGSGLSITEWNVIMGAIPPLNEAEWNVAFEKYKQIPQYQKLNYHFTLSDFKSIFFWEYLHRLIGRIIGLVFIVPFIYFQVKRRMNRELTRKVLVLFLLGAFQGFLGWFMVQSGLTERTSVSHIRLAIHLLAAFVTFGYAYWLWLGLKHGTSAPPSLNFRKLARLLLVVVMLQVVYGAFTAGLHAGAIANTFPTMDGQWIPDGLGHKVPGWKNFTENVIAVQFIHRCLAYIIVALAIILWFTGRKESNPRAMPASQFLLGAVAVQAVLGISTLLTGVPMTLAILHQAGAFFVFGGCVRAFHVGSPVR